MANNPNSAPSGASAENNENSGNEFEWTRAARRQAGQETLSGYNQARTEETKRAAKKSNGLKILFGGIVAALAVGAFAAFAPSGAKNSEATQSSPIPEPEGPKQESVDITRTDVDNEIESVTVELDARFAGETKNGTKYNYTEYADTDNKATYNSYGYDKSEAFGDRDKTADGIMEMAENEPEALASYSYSIFTEEEKESLGIKGLTMVAIDDAFDKEGGGELQQNLLNALDDVLHSEDTIYDFYYENGTEKTDYIYFIDANQDGNYTPNELHLGYSSKKRNNAPQVDIYRIMDKSADGKTGRKVKFLDLNMYCGYQPNYTSVPVGTPEIPEDEQVTKTPTIEPGKGGGQIINTPTHKTNTTPPATPPDTPPTPPPSTPPTPHTPKNIDAEIKNGPGDVHTLDESVTPATTLAEDQANFATIAAQQAADEEAARLAEQIAAQQAAAEEAAKEEAKHRETADESNPAQTAPADEAGKKAEEGASADQRESAQKEQESKQEEEHREEEQHEADSREESHEEEAESHDDDGASERADDFKNGDF